MKPSLLWLIIVIEIFKASYAQNYDTLICTFPLKPVVVSSALIGCGIWASRDNSVFFSDLNAKQYRDRQFKSFNSDIDKFLWITPVIAVYVLDFCGLKSEHSLYNRTILYGSSGLLTYSICGIVKHTVSKQRPDGSDFMSIPSRRTALAFASATFLHEEYKHCSYWYGIAGYSIASATAALRILNNRHYMSDVLIGAASGILITETVYWLFYKITSHFKQNKYTKK